MTSWPRTGHAHRSPPCVQSGVVARRRSRHDEAMSATSRAGQPAEPSDLVDVDALLAAYDDRVPDPDDPDQQVAFGTSGHRGTSLKTSFNEHHILATTQAICDYRRDQGYDGPLFIGRDTHALSEPAWARRWRCSSPTTSTCCVDSRDGFTPTPAVSHAILRANGGRTTGGGLADGIVVTPSHNPPQRRRLQVQPAARRARRHRRHVGHRRACQRADRGPASRRAPGRRTFGPARRRLRLPRDVRRRPAAACSTSTRSATPGVRIGADPLGGASVDYWGEIAERHGLDLTVVNPRGRPDVAVHDPRLGRQDPDGLLVAVRHGLADRAQGRVRHRDRQRRRRRPPRHRHPGRRPDEPQPLPRGRDRLPLRRRPPRLAGQRADRQDPGVVLDDRPGRRRARQADGRGAGRLQVVRARPDRRLVRLRRRGVGRRVVPAPRRHRPGPPTRTASSSRCSPARSSPSPAHARASTTPRWSPSTATRRTPGSTRPPTATQKAKLAALSPGRRDRDRRWRASRSPPSSPRRPATARRSAGSRSRPSRAWFAARPRGTEDVYKIYAESFRGPDHLAQVQAEAREVVSAALG